MKSTRFAFASLFALSTSFLACSSSEEASAPVDQPQSGVDASDELSPDVAEEPAVVPVQFQDANFEVCVRGALAKPDGDLFPEDLATLTALECQDAHISSIAGIEHATSLTDLSLWENQLTDVGPLSGLTQLTYLQLGLNQIQDLQPLSGLTSLRRLGLSVNKIAALAPLSGLAALEWLNLDNNAVADAELVHLASLSNLRWLTLEHNGIADFAAVQPLLDAGCELYGNQKLLAHAQGLSRVAPLSGAVGVPAGKLEVTAGSGGKVSMRYRAGARSVSVRSIFAGALRSEGGRITYEHAGRAVEVGRTGTDSLCTGTYATVCTLSIGRKTADTASAKAVGADELVVTVKLELNDSRTTRPLDGAAWASVDKDLVDFALATPNQFDAGSCLFMANTGAMEVLMNEHTPADQIKPDGDTDLSERYLMVAPDKAPASQVPYDLTDTLYAYNYFGGSLLSRDYPFCAGYVKDTASGSVVLSNADDPDAYISCMVNWFDQLPADWKTLLVPTPPVERTLLFVDPLRDDNSQWRVGLFDDDTIERIKYELRTKNAPVLVVYNHYLYWHTNVIVGYDDNASTGGGCPMVEDSIAYFEKKGMASYATKIKARMAELGGCRDQGVFYVRDSIYDGGLGDPWYDYSTDEVTIEQERRSKRIVGLEYDWAKYLGNHTYAMHRK